MNVASRLLTWGWMLGCVTAAMGQNSLEQQLAALAAPARGTLSMACSLPGTTLRCDLNPHGHPPMQSVFKLPLAVMALHAVEAGQLRLDQPIHCTPQDRILPETYSPLQDEHPAGDVDVPLRELLRLAVSHSDNVAADLVLRTVGGPAAVNGYLHSLGVAGFELQDNEHALNRTPALQYRNWFEPAAVTFLRRLAESSPLTAEHTQLLMQWLVETQTGPGRIKGLLPAGTWVAHKTGTSGTHGGVTAAVNDIGLMRLPDGRMVALAIFASDARATPTEIEAAIARMARAVYDAALAAPPEKTKNMRN